MFSRTSNKDHEDLYKAGGRKDQKNAIPSILRERDLENTAADEPLLTDSSQHDDLYKFKKQTHLPSRFEIYLETEKQYQKHVYGKTKDRMDGVAMKIRRDETLNLRDLKYWVSYNFLVFPEEKQNKIKALYERQHWFWRWYGVLIPPVWFMSFAVLRYQYGISYIKNFIACNALIVGLSSVGLYSSNSEMNVLFNQLYTDYKKEVQDPKYRGLKLYEGKRADQIENKEFTSSNFDDLKRIIYSQTKK